MRASLWVGLVALVALGASGCDELTEVDPDGNTAPVADAGDDQTVYVGETVSLDGWGSADADGDALSYAWAFVAKPDTSSATIESAGSEAASFVPDVPGTYEVALTVTDGEDEATDRVTATASWDLRLSGTISSDTTLVDRGEAYTVTNDVYVNAAVVLEPGVTIEVESGYGIEVTDGGSLTAIGTASDSIRFIGTNPAAGHWDGLVIATASSDNVLSYVGIAHTGAYEHPAIEVATGGRLSLTHSTVRDGNGFGLSLADVPGLLTAFAGNRFEGLGLGSVELSLDGLPMLDTLSTYGDPVEVYASATTAAGRWQAIDNDYHVVSDIAVNHAVVVEPGAVFRFGAGRGLVVDESGSLSAVGAEADTIRFLGLEEVAGHWDGLEFSTVAAANELAWVEVAHTGAYEHAAVQVHTDGRVRIRQSYLHDGAGYGVELDDVAGMLPVFTANTISGMALGPVFLSAANVGSLDEASSYDGAVEIYTSTALTDAAWPALDYYLSGNLSLQGVVTVAPGAVFTVAESLEILVEANGALSAVGTETAPIRFVGQNDARGHWQGIAFGSTNTANELAWVEVANGGLYADAAVLLQSDGLLRIRDSTLRTSSGYGLFVDTGAELAEFVRNTLTDNSIAPLRIHPEHLSVVDATSTYTGNTGDYVEIAASYLEVATSWNALAVPYRSGSITTAAPVTVEAGTEVQFIESAEFVVATGGSLHAVGTAASPIAFIGVSPTAGHWQGIEIDSNNVDNVFDHVEIAHGGRYTDGDLIIHANASATVTNSWLHHATYGIYVVNLGSLILDAGNPNTFSDVTTNIFYEP